MLSETSEKYTRTEHECNICHSLSSYQQHHSNRHNIQTINFSQKRSSYTFQCKLQMKSVMSVLDDAVE